MEQQHTAVRYEDDWQQAEAAAVAAAVGQVQKLAAHASVAHALSHATRGTRAKRITPDEWELKGGQRWKKGKKMFETIARLENDAVPITSTHVVGNKLARPSLSLSRARERSLLPRYSFPFFYNVHVRDVHGPESKHAR